MFDEDVDRIRISTKYDKNKIKTEECYNAVALGKYGICETNEIYPFNWGFCSRSCTKKKSPGWTNEKEPYEEALFEYFDTAPKHSLFSGMLDDIFIYTKLFNLVILFNLFILFNLYFS